ncbi:MAG: hypothetical protein FWD53_01950 [Phycisphaerales bacterium]|nr:hypothetical protein [Phycisphaerales bacterium]
MASLLTRRGSGIVCGVLALVASVLLGGCAERVWGKRVIAEYDGLANKSVAIVVYIAPATIYEFPSAREDVSAFLAAQMRAKMPNVRLLDSRHVIRWQDDTINWFAMSEKQIGRHFGVDRVLYVEVLAYASRVEAGYGDLQGRLRTHSKVFETDTAGDAPAWTALTDVTWPVDRPIEPNRMSEVAVRQRTLNVFAELVVGKLYDHKAYEKRIGEKNN